MATLEDVERRLQEVETRLRRQRRLTAGLAALAVVGLLAALRPPEPEVLRARRLEIVDGADQVVGAFGLGIGPESSTGEEGQNRGWYLGDPVAEVGAAVMIHEATILGGTGEGVALSTMPAVSMTLWSGDGQVDLGASEVAASIDISCGEERWVELSALRERCAITLEGPAGDTSEVERHDVLRLEHTSGKPTLRGWDDEGVPTIDLE